MNMAKTLVKNGTIISMDPGIGIVPKGDILIDYDRIKNIGQSSDIDGAEVVDAKHKIVLPGLINAHIHTWMTALR
jgi:cytosine/adenosine deaminase-related metal-dependent hydrolase